MITSSIASDIGKSPQRSFTSVFKPLLFHCLMIVDRRGRCFVDPVEGEPGFPLVRVLPVPVPRRGAMVGDHNANLLLQLLHPLDNLRSDPCVVDSLLRTVVPTPPLGWHSPSRDRNAPDPRRGWRIAQTSLLAPVRCGGTPRAVLAIRVGVLPAISSGAPGGPWGLYDGRG